MGHGQAPGRGAVEHERLGLQLADHLLPVAPPLGLVGLAAGVGAVGPAVQRGRLGDRVDADQQGGPHDQVPVLAHLQVLVEAQAEALQPRAGQGDRADRGLAVGQVGQQVELLGVGVLHRPEGSLGLGGAGYRPGLHPAGGPDDPARGLGRPPGEDRQPVGAGQVVVVEEGDVVAGGRVQPGVEGPAAPPAHRGDDRPAGRHRARIGLGRPSQRRLDGGGRALGAVGGHHRVEVRRPALGGQGGHRLPQGAGPPPLGAHDHREGGLGGRRRRRAGQAEPVQQAVERADHSHRQQPWDRRLAVNPSRWAPGH